MQSQPVLIEYTKDTLGDFLHKVIPLYVFLKKQDNRRGVVIVNKGRNTALNALIAKMGANTHMGGQGGCNPPTFRQEVQQFFRDTFPLNSDATGDPPGILVHVGSVTKNRSRRNNNRLYQDRLAAILPLFPDRRFTVLGLGVEVVSPAFAQVLRSHRGIVNLLDQTDLPALIQLCYRAERILVRNTGLLHLAGLCNTPVVTLYANCSVLDTVALWTRWRPAVVRNNGSTPEAQRLYYTEKWSPLSDSIVSLVEYRDARYNATVPGRIAAELWGGQDPPLPPLRGDLRREREWSFFFGGLWIWAAWGFLFYFLAFFLILNTS